MCLAKLKSSCVALMALGILSEGREYCLHAQVYHNDFEPGPSVRIPFVPGPDVDASGLDLEGSFFGGFDLPGAKFHGTNLRGARFSQTSFYRSKETPVDPASFRGADLRGAVWSQYYRDLQTADFTDARIEGMVPGPLSPSFFLTPQQIRSTMSYKLKNLSGFYILGGSLSGNEQPAPTEKWTKVGDSGFVRQVALDLRGFDLRNTIFSAGDFTRCNFKDAYIHGTRFSAVKITHEQIASTWSWRGRVLDRATQEAPIAFTLEYLDCSGWDFSELNLRGSTFAHVDLTGANLRRANLREVTFIMCKCDEADFSNADLRGAVHLPIRSVLDDADIRGATVGRITSERLRSTASYKMGDLSGITFTTDLSGMDLSRQLLAGCVFLTSALTGTDFTDAVISGCEFRMFKPEDVPSVEQIKSTWNYKHDRMEGIKMTVLEGLTLPEEFPAVLKNEK